MPDPSLQSAGLIRRLLAGFYDSLLVIALWFLGTTLLLPFTGGEGIPAEHPGYLLYLIAITGLFFYWFWSRNGQTLGMQAWRVRITRTDGQAPGHSAIMLRTALLLGLILATLYGLTLLTLESIPDWFAIPLLIPMAASMLWVLIDPRGRSLHDRLSGTRVVRVPKLGR